MEIIVIINRIIYRPRSVLIPKTLSGINSNTENKNTNKAMADITNNSFPGAFLDRTPTRITGVSMDVPAKLTLASNTSSSLMITEKAITITANINKAILVRIRTVLSTPFSKDLNSEPKANIWEL